MQNRPAYHIQSVDHALRLAILLQQEGSLRVVDAAERLCVARSTAHRLLAMLVYRDFARQDNDRRYHPGDVLQGGSAPQPVGELRRLALPHLRELVRETRETANLMVLAKDHARFVATVECDQLLRVGDREGRKLPAHAASGGLALLAALPDEEVADIYRQPNAAEVDLAALTRKLRRVRRQGFAVNNQAAERGVMAIGHPVHHASRTIAALSVAMPSTRYDRAALPTYVAALSATAAGIERALGDIADKWLLPEE